MALAFSDITYHTDGDKRKIRGLCAVTSGGGTVAPADLGLSQLEYFTLEPTAGYYFQWTKATNAVLAMYGDYNNASDAVFINDTSASVTNVPFEAVGV